MNRKTIIQIAVITICFGLAGIVLYNGLAGDGGGAPAPAVNVAGVPGSGVAPEDPLPYGDDLSDSLKRTLKKNGLQYGNFIYPQVNADETGIQVTDLVKSQTPGQ